MLERLNGLQRATLVLTAIITAMSAAAPLFPVLSRTVTGNAYNMAVLTAVPFLLTVCFLNERNSFAIFTGKIFRPLLIVLLLSERDLLADEEGAPLRGYGRSRHSGTPRAPRALRLRDLH